MHTPHAVNLEFDSPIVLCCKPRVRLSDSTVVDVGMGMGYGWFAIWGVTS